MNLFLNRRGTAGDQTMSFTWLFLILFVAVVVTGGVMLFFGSTIDVQGIESAQITSLIHRCIVSHHIDFAESPTFEQFSQKCGLDAGVLTNSFVLSVFRDAKKIPELRIGDTTACDFVGTRENAYYPHCSEKRFTFEGKEYVIQAGSHQTARRGVA